MKLRKSLTSIAFACLMAFMASAAYAAPPKYVFFFLGDGMSSTQIQATEAYLTQVNGGSAQEAADLLLPQNRLNMSKMPVAGLQTTFDAHALMTDSASSATAFACGIKTLSGVIGMNDTKDTSYKSVAQLAKEQGKKVGVISSVSLDHATPAAYYASVPSRGNMNDICVQMANTGYEFFGGGGLAKPTAPTDVWALLAANGYEVLNTKADIEDLLTNPRDKVVAINPVLPGSAAMPYAIDKPEENLSLAEITNVAIKVLSANDGHGRGFFLMVEGGKIDWAGHANDAVANIGDMIDFDNAVGMALEFYRAHPRDTLIVVTGDHETGGMTIGHATTGYKAYYEKLLGQTKSYENFQANDWVPHKTLMAPGVCGSHLGVDNLATDSAMINLMQTVFGLDYYSLNDYQKEKLEDAYDKSMCGTNDNSGAENTFLYSGYEPIVVTLTHILNENASIGWTSYSHTGVPVPVFAQGAEARNFYGFYDNTDIAKKLARIMGIKQTLPIVK
ncbi:MAG: alkaline phosphatase [Proteobacteria bacterium]|nr:alkaline phosphatase [Pseudomonadota bacterium]MBU1387939.1 alkaline phosphatase [Pseudomonadota bacterium]MBU1542002.1 alkaline phosphatase [Pseudomonadota bacterium]MBU2430573.1 alkaline phosphatase [Pseudomonadota bacterium]MBU2481927.1 alkaline phosphatase [Pseudomonadota bacterium]